MYTFIDLNLTVDQRRRIQALPEEDREVIQSLTASNLDRLHAEAIDLLEGFEAPVSPSPSLPVAQAPPAPAGPATPPVETSNADLVRRLLALEQERAREREALGAAMAALESQRAVIQALEHERRVAKLATLPEEYGPDARLCARLLAECHALGHISLDTHQALLLRMVHFVAFSQCRDSARAARVAEVSRYGFYSSVPGSLAAEDSSVLTLLTPLVAEVLKTIPAAPTSGSSARGAKNRQGPSRTSQGTAAASTSSASAGRTAVADSARPAGPQQKPAGSQQ